MNRTIKYITGQFTSRGLAAAAVSLLFICCVGCDNGDIITRSQTLPKAEDSAEFLDRISSLPIVSEDDALRGILLLIDGKDTAGSFQQRVEMLQQRGIAPRSWDYVSNRGITRGKYAYMIYQAAKFKGGIILSLTGPSRRYCLRELQFKKVMANGPMLTEVTGMEYVAVLGRADTFIRTGSIPNRSGETENEQQLETR